MPEQLHPFAPVGTLADLDTLNEDEIVAGYREFRRDDPPPGANRGRAYWHGWRNAARDSGMIEGDDAMAALAAEYVRRTGRCLSKPCPPTPPRTKPGPRSWRRRGNGRDTWPVGQDQIHDGIWPDLRDHQPGECVSGQFRGFGPAKTRNAAE